MLRVTRDNARKSKASLTGNVQGVPVMFEGNRLYYGIEHPMSNATTRSGIHK